MSIELALAAFSTALRHTPRAVLVRSVSSAANHSANWRQVFP